MPLFTILLEYRGGTYVSQVRAAEVRKALLAWAECLDPRVVRFLGPARKRRVLEFLNNERYAENFQPVLLSGLTNVWCTSVGLPGSLVNIVQTIEG